MNSATVSGTTFELRGPGGAQVNAAVSYDAATRTAILDPAAALAASTTYTATVKGGASGVRDTIRQRARQRPNMVLHNRRRPTTGGLRLSVFDLECVDVAGERDRAE